MVFLSALTGQPDERLLEHGLPGCGLIREVIPTETTMTFESGAPETLCIFILQVRLPAHAPYHTTVRQCVAPQRMSEIEPGQTLVAVRVDARNPVHVAIDWDAPVVATDA